MNKSDLTPRAKKRRTWSQYWFRLKMTALACFLSVVAAFGALIWFGSRDETHGVPRSQSTAIAPLVSPPVPVQSPQPSKPIETKPDKTWVDEHWRTNKDGTKSLVKGHWRKI